MKTLTIIKPDDLHLHLREGLVLKNIIQFTSEYFGRAIVMPNTKSPITSINSAISYKKSIVEALPESSKFEPLMTIYLTDETDKKELIKGFKDKVFFAAKLYPANATTNSNYGVKKIKNLYEIFESMQDHGIPLLIHGEVSDPEVDIFPYHNRQYHPLHVQHLDGIQYSAQWVCVDHASNVLFQAIYNVDVGQVDQRQG